MKVERCDEPQIQKDDDLLSYAEDTVRFENESFDTGEVEAKAYSPNNTAKDERHQACLLVFETTNGKSGKQHVREEPIDGDRNPEHLGINALIDDFTVPLFAKVAYAGSRGFEVNIDQIHRGEHSQQIQDDEPTVTGSCDFHRRQFSPFVLLFPEETPKIGPPFRRHGYYGGCSSVG